jgi:ClpP class serine protease
VSFPILRALTGSPWLIHPDEVATYYSLVQALMQGKPVAETQEQPKIQVMAAAANVVQPYYADFSDTEIPKGSTALIPVSGPILKPVHFYRGWASSQLITQYVKQANANPNISHILFVIDSPGGMVDGTQTAAQAIAASEKPTLAFVDDGMAASAAYWLASAADEVWVSQQTDRVGSIGAYRTFMDASKYFEKLGVKVEDVYADQSSEKNQDYREAMKGNYKPMKEKVLNRMVDAFISAVKEYRGNRLNMKAGDPFKGATYMAEEALKIGLIDKVGTIEEALSYLQSKTNKLTKTESSMSLKNWFAKGGDEKTVAVDASELAELKADMQSAQKELETAQATSTDLAKKNAELAKQLEEAQASEKTAQEALAAAEKDRDEYKANAEKFGKQAGAAHSAPPKDKPEGGNAEEAKTEEEQFSAYSHNQEAINEIKNF